jgi:hypothetical protein
MCNECLEIDLRIDHHQVLASRISDQLTLDGIKELIEEMRAKKAALHSEEEVKPAVYEK